MNYIFTTFIFINPLVSKFYKAINLYLITKILSNLKSIVKSMAEEIKEIKKKIMVVLEFRPKEFSNSLPLSPEYIHNIKLVPIHGGYLDQNMLYSLGIMFPDDVEIFKKHLKVMSVGEHGIIEEIKEI